MVCGGDVFMRNPSFADVLRIVSSADPHATADRNASSVGGTASSGRGSRFHSGLLFRSFPSSSARVASSSGASLYSAFSAAVGFRAWAHVSPATYVTPHDGPP